MEHFIASRISAVGSAQHCMQINAVIRTVVIVCKLLLILNLLYLFLCRIFLSCNVFRRYMLLERKPLFFCPTSRKKDTKIHCRKTNYCENMSSLNKALSCAKRIKTVHGNLHTVGVRSSEERVQLFCSQQAGALSHLAQSQGRR